MGAHTDHNLVRCYSQHYRWFYQGHWRANRYAFSRLREFVYLSESYARSRQVRGERCRLAKLFLFQAAWVLLHVLWRAFSSRWSAVLFLGTVKYCLRRMPFPRLIIWGIRSTPWIAKYTGGKSLLAKITFSDASVSACGARVRSIVTGSWISVLPKLVDRRDRTKFNV